MTDNLRDRIAQAIYDSSDEYTRKLMVRPDCPGASDVEGEWKPVCYRWADAVIRDFHLTEDSGVIVGCLHDTPSNDLTRPADS